MAASDVTAIFSNMSVVRMPEAYVPYIERFGVYHKYTEDGTLYVFILKTNFPLVLHRGMTV